MADYVMKIILKQIEVLACNEKSTYFVGKRNNGSSWLKFKTEYLGPVTSFLEFFHFIVRIIVLINFN